MDITPYLKLMVQKRASDLFFTAGTQVKIKIDGVIQSIGDTVFEPGMCTAAIHSVLTKEQIDFFENHREIDFGIGLSGHGRFRINAFHQRGTPAMVIRFLTSKIPTIDELGLPEILKRLVMHRRGIILMVGATGSGKSTTLAAMIDHRNSTKPGHILTIEDPIEYIHAHKQSIINQRELGIDTKDYATALKSSLREAPDVILIGEIRTRETMEAAIELSGTGHLAISTLHANNAYQTMERIINMFPMEMHKTLFMDLSLNLRAIISQRLVRTVEGKRVAAIEILMNTPHISDLIREGRVDEMRQAMAESKEEGMVTFDEALLKLYRDGRISLDECLGNADSAANLEARINFG
ncbi:PilT/PilU family type 4a pilus ATPase [Thiorhodovibrio frisius]|uniref:Pilus retraction protein PilT n=1 Tax=Thiorhodovibrio frisius TaxID=631362 RepID=H8YZV1_9GAMM|nr:PilT/PilU family type 4a pilus ATPase [Thiorhodovibrio frisius]EIC22228.1 pilus retraction protein PilT [Thiorhodovibrio frisius]WPL24522.1 Twitching mobility protein [Thiorhodovibrio frisius]